MEESFNTELKKFFCQHCTLKHEKVRLQRNSVPVKDEITESGYKRIGLCDMQHRNKNLTCAHTAARKHFKALLKLMSETSEDKAGFDSLANKVRDLDLKIVLIDVEKNNAEVEYAKLMDLLRKSEKESEERSKVKAQIRQVKISIANIMHVHNGLVDEMQQCLNEAFAKAKAT